MKHWPKKTLGELCDVVAGGTPSRTCADFYNGEIPWVKIGDMLQGTVTQTEETISQLGLDNSAAKLLPEGTILISIFATIGRTAVLGIQAATNQAIAGITPKNAREITTYFLRYFLDYSVVNLAAEARGVAQLNINGKILKSLFVPVPPLAEQERIVHILDEADELRKLRAQADRRTADLIPALFHEMFGDPATNPKKWKLTAISEMADVQGGLQLTPLRDTYTLKRPYLRVANIQRGFLMLDEIKEIGLLKAEYERTKLVKGDLLLVEGNGNPKEVGRAAIWNGAVENCVHQNHLIRVRPTPRLITSDYLLAFVNSESGRNYFHGSGNTTSGLVTISTSIVKNCRIPVPPLPLQQEFAQHVAEIREMEADQAKSKSRLDALFHSLLHHAFEGEL